MGTNLYLPVALILCASLSSQLAYAEEAAPVATAEAAEIQLKDGTSKRGTIVSVEPGQRVIIIVAGEQSVIPWAEVAKIVGGPKESQPTVIQAAPSPAPAAPALAAAPVPAKGMPVVHIESNWAEAELHRVDGELGVGTAAGQNRGAAQTLSRYVCRAPCDKPIDGREGHRFFIMAPGMYPSPHFRLEGYEGPVTARVEGVSFSRYAGGVASVAAGGMFTLGGGMFFGMSYISENETPSEENPNPKKTAEQVRTIGLAIGAVGLVGVAVGLVMLSAGNTRVEIVEASRGHSGLVFDNGVFRF